jgi:putative nucleotidyltransferase with HDIG domain
LEAHSVPVWTGPTGLRRLCALALALVAVPGVLSASLLVQDQPIRADQPSPRTVIAPEVIRVTDQEATARAKRSARADVSPILDADTEATAAIVQDVRDAFAAVSDARTPGDRGRVPSASQQVEALGQQLPMLSKDARQTLVGFDDEELASVRDATVSIAQRLARRSIRPGEVEQVADQQLPNELAVRSLPGEGTGEEIVAPIARDALRPTVRLDEAATARARDEAAADVSPVVKEFPQGSVIVSAGEMVSQVELTALRENGLQGADPVPELLRTFGLMVVLTAAVGGYLRSYRPHVWGSTSRLLLLACLFTLFAIALEPVDVITAGASPAWLFVIPVGAVTMLATILFDPPVGVLTTIPVAALVAYTAPGQPGVTAFATVAALVSIPLVSRLSARGDLRRAAWQSTLAYVVLAGAFAAVFQELSTAPLALLAGLVNGVLSALLVNATLPFLESAFGVLTATSLLDLSDRNHPLLRELEQRALGSYNHSVMVAQLVERACREIGADATLASVAALYHDIGKVAAPTFFVENQFGIDNPHDGLDPRISAEVIMRHVEDGQEKAEAYHMPPEVTEGIRTHHGTTLVSYFYRQARSDGETVAEEDFRYRGGKPHGKEMAVLMLADCCESAARAAARNDRNLSSDDLQGLVTGLVDDRVADGQLDEAELSFRELAIVRRSLLTSLEGIYHPRIPYPETPAEAAIGTDSSETSADAMAPADR